jgi:hypothetical protein
MAWTPQKIALIARGRYDEGVLAADAYPGMSLVKNSSGLYIPNNLVGGNTHLMVATEDVSKGGNITQKLNSGDAFPFYHPAKGDVFTMLLQNGQNVAINAPLMSAGDGTLIAALTPDLLYKITAPSTTITNLGTETAFSNGSYTLPANTLAVGDVFHIRAKVFLIAVNSTNTHRVRVYVGATPVTVADSGALALIANDVMIFDITMTVRTITASGTIIADGFIDYSISGTFTHLPFTIASSTLDSTVANPIVIKSLASATSAGNQIRLDEFSVDIDRTAGLTTTVLAAEAINNSAGAGSSPMSGFSSAAFIRCLVP